MTLIEHGKCEIEHLNDQGLGISRNSHGKIELPYVLPGEIVAFERHRYRGKTDFILKEVICESLSRIVPVCQYFSACGGCSLQHIHADDYIKFKASLIENLLVKHQITTRVNPLILIPFGVRRRANLKVLKKNDQVYLGFQRVRSHQIINIDECPAILKNMSNLLKPLKQLCLQIFENHQKAEIHLSQAANGMHILFNAKACITLTDAQNQELENFAISNEVIQIVFESEKSKKIIYQSKFPYVEFDGKKVEIEADSFLQTSTHSDIIFKDLILKFFASDDQPPAVKIVDLFCGRGTFTLPLTKYFTVNGFESEPCAITALSDSIKKYNLPATVHARDLFAKPLSSEELDKFSYAVINPPRVGAKAQIEELAKSNIEKIAYISCNPQSFIKDAEKLTCGGYKLIEVTPIDQFPMTAHLEIVATFVKTTP